MAAVCRVPGIEDPEGDPVGPSKPLELFGRAAAEASGRRSARQNLAKHAKLVGDEV